MKIAQKQIAFYILYKGFKKDPTEYLPTWVFVGEINIEPLNTWVLASYKCPARLSEIFQENTGLLERRHVHGKSGAYYYEYRIAPNPAADKIKDQNLYDFYKKIKSAE